MENLIDILIPNLGQGDPEQFKAAISKFRRPKPRYTMDVVSGMPIAEFDRDNIHVIIRTCNGEPHVTMWEKKEFGYIAHILIHNVTAEYTYDQIPF
jgi:hypothetical protein